MILQYLSGKFFYILKINFEYFELFDDRVCFALWIKQQSYFLYCGAQFLRVIIFGIDNVGEKIF